MLALCNMANNIKCPNTVCRSMAAVMVCLITGGQQTYNQFQQQQQMPTAGGGRAVNAITCANDITCTNCWRQGAIYGRTNTCAHCRR
jgi:hypothetical protein